MTVKRIEKLQDIDELSQLLVLLRDRCVAAEAA